MCVTMNRLTPRKIKVWLLSGIVSILKFLLPCRFGIESLGSGSSTFYLIEPKHRYNLLSFIRFFYCFLWIFLYRQKLIITPEKHIISEWGV